MATKKRAATVVAPPERDASVASRPQQDRELWCFGVYRAADGNWILRNVKCNGTKVLEIHDSEPDILAIQMGKIEAELDRQAERQVNGYEEGGR